MLALAALGAGGAVIVASSAAAPSTKPAHAAFQPVPFSAAAGSTGTYTLHIENGSSNQTFGSVNVSVPQGFSVAASSITVDRGWTKTFNTTTKVIELRTGTSGTVVPPGGKLVVTFTATAPCTSGSIAWPTVVKQSNNFSGPPGNDFLVDPQPSVTLTGAGPPTFVFATAPSTTIDDPQVVGTAFAVTVTAKDGCGNTDTAYTGTPTFGGLAAGATYGSLVFTAGSGGVAVANVTPAQAETDATLTAVDGARQGESDEFDVVDVLCTADDESELCEASDLDGVTSISTARPTGTAKLAISFGDSASDCVSSLIGSSVTLVPLGYTSPTQVTFTWDKSETPGTGVANFRLCWSKPEQPAEELEKCGKPPERTCEVSRSRTGVGDLKIVVQLDPEDPSFELG